MVFPSNEERLDAIGEVMTGIESETLTAVFEHWMERPEWMSKNNGDYYSETTSWFIYFSPMSIRNRVAKPEWHTLYKRGERPGHRNEPEVPLYDDFKRPIQAFHHVRPSRGAERRPTRIPIQEFSPRDRHTVEQRVNWLIRDA
jgi:hypothetical protein